MPTERKTRRQYKTVSIPSDCESNPERRFNMAVNEARDMFRDYVMPAQWELIKDDGENVTVCRISYKPAK